MQGGLERDCLLNLSGNYVQNFNVSGNFLESCKIIIQHPRKRIIIFVEMLLNWTSSYYIPYPRFKPFKGILAEYNNKFMANQLVLRGGSCLTPKSHYRHTYRNFYPHDRWQMSSIKRFVNLNYTFKILMAASATKAIIDIHH